MTHIKRQNFINSGAVHIIRTVYYIHGPELMKLIFAVLCVMNDGPYTCYKTEVFFTFITLSSVSTKVFNTLK